jgi:hypothetical protein
VNKSYMLVAAVAAVVSAELRCQDWVPVSPASAPSARSKHAMVFARGSVVLFGGADASVGEMGDTWTWSGSDWTEQPSLVAPVARVDHAMAYDFARGKIVLFGGKAAGVDQSDTWEWGETGWSFIATTAAPSPRSGHAMTHDSHRGVVALYGGHDSASALGDQWNWDGANWVSVASATNPGSRYGHALSFDSQRGKVVLFGGASSCAEMGDTWEWNGTDWSSVTTVNAPSARKGHGMSYDNVRGVTVLFGGSQLGAPLGDSWTFDGTDWAQTTGATPPASEDPSLAYDVSTGKTVTFPNTWSLQPPPVTAAITNFGTGCGPTPLSLDSLPGVRPILGASQVVDITNIPFGLAFMAYGNSSTIIQSSPLPMSLNIYGMPGCTLYHNILDFALPMVPVSSGRARYVFNLPFSSVFIGYHIYLQGWALHPGYNAAGMTASNGADMLLGNQ